MSKFLSKVGKWSGRFILWLCTAFILIVIISQISLWFGLQWLNSEKGEAWTKQQIDIALKDSDYKIDYSGFRYYPLTSLKVKDLSLSNGEDLVFEAENTKVGVNILPLAMRNLSLNFVSDKVVLHKIPNTKDSNVEKPKNFYLEKFSLPNLYFNEFDIAQVSINNLEIKKSVLGQEIKISPVLKGGIGINESNLINFDLLLQPDANQMSNIPFLPKEVMAKGQFNTDKAMFELENLLIYSDVYRVSTSGSTVFREEGKIDFITEVISENLSKITPEINGDFKSNIKVSGTQNELELDINGKAMMPILEKRGLQPIKFNLKSNYQQAEGLQPINITVASFYKDIPVELTSLIEKKGSNIIAQNIKGNAPDVYLSGDLSYNLNDTIATGNIITNIGELSTYKDLLQMDITGKLKANINLSKSDLGQQAVVKVNGSGFQYDNVTLKKAEASLTFPSLDNYWPTEAKWLLKDMSASAVTLSQMSGTVSRKTEDIYSLNTQGKGEYNVPFSFKMNTDLLALDTKKPKAQNINGLVRFNNQPIEISGRVNMDDLDLLVQAKSFDLAAISENIPETLQKTNMSGDMKIKGLMASPIIDGDIYLSAFSLSKKTPEIKINLNTLYKDKMTTITLTGVGKGIKNLSGQARTPVNLSLNPFIFELPARQTIDGQVNLDLDMSRLSKIFLPPQYRLSGLLQSNLDMRGVVQNPLLQGRINIADAQFTDENFGVSLNNINAQGDLSNDKFILERLTANDNEKGSIEASGNIGLNSFVPQNVDMKLDVKDFHLLDSELADGMFDANIKLSGTPEQYNLKGIIQPDYIDINIPERLITNIPKLNIVEEEEESNTQSLMNKILLNIQFIADNKIFVRGWGLDAEFGGKLKIDGTLDDPNFDGVLKSSRGRYTEFGIRFELTRANLNFLGRVPANPIMDIVAETKVEDILAQVNIQGTIPDPKITFSANPSLPEDEVLARILFGRDLSSISPFQAVQLAQTARRFSGRGGSGFDPLGTMRDATGFDDLRVDTDEEGETTVGAGKYISDKVYLEFEKGSGENSGAANLEVEVTPNVTLESQVGQDAQAGAGLFWEWDY